MSNDWTSAPYVRVFVTLADDRPELWSSDELLAWYVRLLVGANAHYPASSPIPRDVPPAVLDSLESIQVVDVEGDRYRFHGLAKVREAVGSRGYAGGRARARVAARNAGRFAGRDAGPPTLVDDAGRLNSNAGRDAGRDAGSDAGTRRWSSTLVAEVDEAGDAAPLFASSGDAGPSTLVADAGNPVPDAGPTLVGTLVRDAGRPANQRKEKNRDTGDVDPPNVGSSSPGVKTPPASASAGAREAPDDDPTGPVSPAKRAAMVASHGPDDARCDEPQLHPLHHRWYAGVGWVCLICERSDTRSFDDRIVEAGGSPF